MSNTLSLRSTQPKKNRVSKAISKEITVSEIQNLIINLPGRPPAMLAGDLTTIYNTTTKAINQAVKRNKERFPDDFVFQITKDEVEFLRSQSVTFKQFQEVMPYLPYCFTKMGANMLSAVLHTDIAIQRSIQIMRAFSEIEKKAIVPTIPTDLSRMQLIQLAMDAETERLAAVKEIKRLAPKAEAWEEFTESDGLYPLTMAFKFLKLQPNVHTKRMLEDNILYKLNKVNVPFQRYIQQGYFELKTKEDDGVFTQTYVTPKGLEFLKRKYKGMKYLEVIS